MSQRQLEIIKGEVLELEPSKTYLLVIKSGHLDFQEAENLKEWLGTQGIKNLLVINGGNVELVEKRDA